jgi:hypothetical protein
MPTELWEDGKSVAVRGRKIQPAPSTLFSEARMTPEQFGRFAAAGMLLTLVFASQPCAPAFTDVRMIGKGRVG